MGNVLYLRIRSQFLERDCGSFGTDLRSDWLLHLSFPRDKSNDDGTVFRNPLQQGIPYFCGNSPIHLRRNQLCDFSCGLCPLHHVFPWVAGLFLYRRLEIFHIRASDAVFTRNCRLDCDHGRADHHYGNRLRPRTCLLSAVCRHRRLYFLPLFMERRNGAGADESCSRGKYVESL